jgi:hypothetical protein
VLVVNFSFSGRAATVDFAHNPGGYTGDDGMWGNILGDDCTGSHDSAFTNADPVCHDGVGSQPDIIFDHDSGGGDPLLDKRLAGIVKNVVDCDQLSVWGGVYSISDGHSTLPADDCVFADQAVTTNADSGMWEIAEIVDMQYRSMHDQSVGADFDTIRAGVDINALVQIAAMLQANVVRKPYAYTPFDGGVPVDVHDHAVKNGSQSYSDHGRNPPKNEHYSPFKPVPASGRSLPGDIESQEGEVI